MPELPEVETMRRGVAAVKGAAIGGVERPTCRKRPILISPRIDQFQRRVKGIVIRAVERIGKRVVFQLDSGDAIVIEPRMTGLVLLTEPPTREHLRLRISLIGSRVPEILFWDRRGLGTVRLVSKDDFEQIYGLERIGPDALKISLEQLQHRLQKSRRAIKIALLDQQAVAGIGNLYAAEILHLARIDPRQTCDTLTRPQWNRLHTATREVLKLAIRHEGSTLGDGTYRNALNKAGRYQNKHRVYARAGKPCPSCAHGIIERIVQAQRSTFFCPKCQGPASL